MANTNKLTNISISKKEAWVYFTLASDGTEETNLPIYDSSVVATAFGDSDPLTSAIIDVFAVCNAASTARVVLRWDAATPILAMTIPAATNPTKFCAGEIGSLPNPAGTGITGDITLTTTGLESGDSITILLRVKRQ